MQFPNVTTPAPRKMEELRALAAKHGGDWRAYRDDYRYRFRPRYPAYNPPFKGYGDQHVRWVENVDAAGLREVDFADKIIRLSHNGWYADNFQDEVLRGVVFQLPARHGKPRYVYGYMDPCNKGAALLSFDPCDDKDDAAHWADDFARIAAEEHKEADAKFQAEQQIDNMRDTIKTLRDERRSLLREIKEAGKHFTPAICSALREKILEIRDESRKVHRRIEKLTDNYWLAVE